MDIAYPDGEVLEVFPSGHPEREEIPEIYKTHVAGVTSYQSGSRFWYQLLNLDDFYKTP